ncbi:putative polyketide cyclase / dehydrase and lipid transport [Lyophyllum shimeji]|uniref:Polyketide cyclase / dehydrase and lipid transport n=1 Tax=Lyophyllum shimeji TaxID=47721 RepID=A0A9P3PD94_LYOSH|nr:putative polyketide cyclase / dehydrase and lipid transport [Lyophyllum shimeji]
MQWSAACSPLVRWSLGPACRRTIFSLPNFPDLAPWNKDTEPQTYHERKILPYGQRELYDIVADVASYPRFIPFCTGSRIVTPPSRTPLRADDSFPAPFEMEAELTVGFLSFKEKYVSQVTCKPYESVQAVASSSTPLFKTLTTTWRFQPASGQSPHPSYDVLHPSKDQARTSPTLVTLDLAYAFANPIHASVSSAFFGKVSKLMVKAFEERCLAVYGPGSA